MFDLFKKKPASQRENSRADWLRRPFPLGAVMVLFRFTLGLCVLAIAMLAGIAFGAEIGSPVAAPAQAAWLTLVLGLAPWLIGLVLGWHLLRHLGTYLEADGKKRGGVLGKLEVGLSVAADDLDDYLSANGQSLKDLTDPAKRATAEAALAAQAKAQASKVVDDALKGVL